MPPPERFEVRQTILEHESVDLFSLSWIPGNYSTLPGVSRDEHDDIISHEKIYGYPYFRGNLVSKLLKLDFNVHAGRQIQAHQRIDRLWGRFKNINQTFMSAHLKLFS